MAELRRRLAEVGLEDLAETLAAHDVGLDVLALIDEAELEEIGLSLGQRKRFLRALPDLLADSAAGPAPRERPPHEAERRQMTIVFCDTVGSTALSRRLDPEDMFAVVASGSAAASRSSSATAATSPNIRATASSPIPASPRRARTMPSGRSAPASSSWPRCARSPSARTWCCGPGSRSTPASW